MVPRAGGRDEDVAVIDMQEQSVIDVRERPSSGPLKSLIIGVREWITIDGGYEPHVGPAGRTRTRESDTQSYRDQSRLHWPDGVRVSSITDAAERVRRN